MYAIRSTGITKSGNAYKDAKSNTEKPDVLANLQDILDGEEEVELTENSELQSSITILNNGEVAEDRQRNSITKSSRNSSIVSNHSMGDKSKNIDENDLDESEEGYTILLVAKRLAYGDLSGPFNNFMLVWIVCATVMVGLQTYSTLETNEYLVLLDYIVLAFFTFEVIVKFFGLSTGGNFKVMLHNYFLGPEKWWNIFDLAVVVMSMPGVIPASAGSSIYILRLARLARIAKLLNKIPQLRMIISGLIAGLKAIGYIMILLALVFYIYAIAGIIFFKENDPLRFRNIQITMITLFQLSTFDDWPLVLFTNYYGCDEYGGEYFTPADDDYDNAIDMYKCSNPVKSKYLAPIYFVSFIMISIILVSLFIGTITMSMSQSTAEMKIEQEQEARDSKIKREARKVVQDVKSQLKKKKSSTKNENEGLINSCITQRERILQRKKDKLRNLLANAWGIKVEKSAGDEEIKGCAKYYDKLASIVRNFIEGQFFTNFITLTILLAGVQAGIEADYVSLKSQSDTMEDFLTKCNIFVLIVFTLEVVLKFISYDFTPLEYFTSGWNIFDLVIVLGSFIIPDGGLIMILRLLRLFRMLKLVKSLPQLAVIVSALLKGFQSIGFIGILLFLVYYVFAIVGVMFFSRNLPMYFVDLHTGMLSLFRHSTLEGWSGDMYQNFYGCETYGDCDAPELNLTGSNEVWSWFAAVYNILFVVLGSWVMLTLFIGVVTASMEEAQEEDKVKKKIQQNLRTYQKEEGISDNVIRMYKQAFQMLDLDNSGLIQVDELKIGFISLGIKISNAEVMEYMKQIDEDCDGTIDQCEFVIFMSLLRSDSISDKKFQLLYQNSMEDAGPGLEMKQLGREGSSKKVVPIG